MNLENNENAEASLIICCARTQLSSETVSQIESLICAGISWKTLLELAEYHSVLPLLFRNLSAVCPQKIPREVFLWLESEFYRNTFQSLQLLAEQAKVLAFLESHGVNVVPFKGVTLAAIAYGSPSFRAAGDIDILVGLQDYPRVQNLLSKQAYRPRQEWFLLEKHYLDYSYYVGEYPLFRENICLDVHCRLDSGEVLRLSSDFDRFWKRLVPVNIGGTNVQSLNAEDLLLYLCINGIRDLWTSLKTVCDVAELICRHPELNWKWVEQEAKELGIERIVGLGLLIAQRTFNISIPSDTHQTICTDAKICWLAARICKRLHSNSPMQQATAFERTITHLLALDWMRDRINYCLRSMFRIFKLYSLLVQTDQDFLPLPRRLYFLHYFVKPIRLLNRDRLRVLKLLFP